MRIEPLTADREPELCVLFRATPATADCWCMWPRTPRGAMWDRTAEENEADFRSLVVADTELGLIALDDGGAAVGWCSNAPLVSHARFAGLATEPGLWVLACVAVHPDARRRGVPGALIAAAIARAAEHGATAIVGLPVGWRADSAEGLERLLTAMRSAGFVEEPELPEAFQLRYTLA